MIKLYFASKITFTNEKIDQTFDPTLIKYKIKNRSFQDRETGQKSNAHSSTSETTRNIALSLMSTHVALCNPNFAKFVISSARRLKFSPETTNGL